MKISETALFNRIKRALSKEGMTLKKCASRSRHYNDFGDFYITDTDANAVVNTHRSLEGLAEEVLGLDSVEIVAAN